MSSQRDSGPDDGDAHARSENTKSDLRQSFEPRFEEGISPFPPFEFPSGMGTANNISSIPSALEFFPKTNSNKDIDTVQVSDDVYTVSDGREGWDGAHGFKPQSLASSQDFQTLTQTESQTRLIDKQKLEGALRIISAHSPALLNHPDKLNPKALAELYRGCTNLCEHVKDLLNEKGVYSASKADLLAPFDPANFEGRNTATKYRCRYDSCRAKRSTRPALLRHLQFLHFSQFDYIISHQESQIRFSRRDKFISRFRQLFQRTPSKHEIERCKSANACPEFCPICLRYVTSWPVFYDCFMSHCISLEEASVHERPTPVSEASRKKRRISGNDHERWLIDGVFRNGLGFSTESASRGLSNSMVDSDGEESTGTSYGHLFNKLENEIKITPRVNEKREDLIYKWEDCVIDKSSPFLANKASLESVRSAESSGSPKITTLSVPRCTPDLVHSESSKSWDIGSALVLVGGSQDAHATTCLEYVRSIWKIEGQQLIEGFLSVCKHKGDVMGDYLGMQWRIHDDDDKDFIPVTFGLVHSGHERYLYRLATLFTWLVSVFPHSQPSNLEINGPHKCAVSIIRKQEPTTSHDELTFEIQEGISAPIPESHGSCWHSLFKGGAIAYGYPIPQRGGEIGVEIPFEAMVQLSRVSYTLELPTGGTILKGHSTMLVPTNGASPDSVQWHFIGSSQPGEHISADRIPQELKEQVLDLNIEALAKHKAYLGYCRTAYVQIGTKQSMFEQATKSQIGCAKSTWRIGREISASVGSEGTGIFGGNITTKFILTRPLYAQILEEETCLMDRLLNSKNNSTLLYDPEKKTGFLVPEINVVLQIVHIWASQQPDSEDLLAKMPFVPPNAEEGQVACEIIMLNRDLLLREGYADEKKLFFTSKLKNVFLSLEKRREQQRLIQETSFSIGFSNYIRGWEIFDIATCQPSQEKRLDLPLKHGACWTKIPRHHPEILVLFYKGLADPMIPGSNDVCQKWDPLPQEYYLMASVSCVKSLSEKIGGGSCQLRLTESLYLQAPEKGKTLWCCYDCESGGCSHVQILGPKPSLCQAPSQRGAILFGKRVVRKPKHHISLT